MFLVFHKHTFQVHMVEVEKIQLYMMNGNFCLQFFGKTPGNLMGKPVLTQFCLQKSIQQQYEQHNAKQNTERYFPNLSQSIWGFCKNNQTSSLHKFITCVWHEKFVNDKNSCGLTEALVGDVKGFTSVPFIYLSGTSGLKGLGQRLSVKNRYSFTLVSKTRGFRPISQPMEMPPIRCKILGPPSALFMLPIPCS